MAKILANALLPFALFSSAMVLLGCEQAVEPPVQPDEITASKPELNSEQPVSSETAAERKSGNMFYIVRDVADMQLKAGDYVEQLKQIQSELQTALNDQDQLKLQATANVLKQQLNGLNQTLNSLNLKSQEIDSIRQNMIQANQQVLATPLFKGDIDLTQVDFKKIEQQLNSVQLEMIKLAGMLIPDNQKQSTQEG